MQPTQKKSQGSRCLKIAYFVVGWSTGCFASSHNISLFLTEEIPVHFQRPGNEIQSRLWQGKIPDTGRGFIALLDRQRSGKR